MAAEFTTTISNMAEPNNPFVIVHFTNVLKLNPSNYIAWKTQIQATLIGYDLFKFIDGSHLAPASMVIVENQTTLNPAYTTWMRQDKLLFGALVGTLSTSVASLVTQASTTQDAWVLLEQTYAKPSRGHIKQMKEKLKNITKGTQPIAKYIQTIKACLDHLSTLGKPLDQEDLIDFVLQGLDSSYQSVIDAVNARDTPITLEGLHEKLINKELSLKVTGSTPLLLATTMHVQAKPPNKNRSKPSYRQ
ncbi:hypothetical protein L6164_037462 [Bauhinia variegata]|uniref:Uncharacterized protein n=1 Tax=Bauhinia variegata TaxID=167791 RepID=A0ACB9KK88_BAUVA|nr:hypothetical protein L6164_037462 [Bauhinia variegata]